MYTHKKTKAAKKQKKVYFSFVTTRPANQQKEQKQSIYGDAGHIDNSLI